VPAVELKGSLWEELPDAMNMLHEDELRTLFKVQPLKSSKSVAEPARSSSKAQLLDLRRSNQINIALVKFKCSHEELRDAALKLDERVIKPEDVGRLRKIMPTAEEVEMLRSSEGAPLGEAERFLLLMTEVPRLEQRLECFQAKTSFDQRLIDAEAQINALTWASDCVKNSKQLPILFGLILQIGNCLNAGSMKGGAKGFRFDVLQKLNDTKSSSSAEAPKQISLMHYIARCAVNEYPDISKALQDELRSLEEAHQPPLTTANIDAEILALAKDIDTMKTELPHHLDPVSSADHFHRVMTQFIENAAARLSNLQQKRDDMYSKLRALHVFFGQVKSDLEPEQLLSRVHAFTVSFGKACRDNEREELRLRKRQEAEAKMKEAGDNGQRSRLTRSAMRKVLSVPSHVMNSIQGSLRRGEFAQMKALQAQMSYELAHHMAERRSKLTDFEE
ncbi:MAG: hypothetical protein SGPRY_012607, partial [Prymnesium sp.]